MITEYPNILRISLNHLTRKLIYLWKIFLSQSVDFESSSLNFFYFTLFFSFFIFFLPEQILTWPMIMFLSNLLKPNPGRPRNIRAAKAFVLFHLIHQMMKYDKYKKLLKKQRSVQTYILQIINMHLYVSFQHLRKASRGS